MPLTDNLDKQAELMNRESENLEPESHLVRGFKRVQTVVIIIILLIFGIVICLTSTIPT